MKIAVIIPILYSPANLLYQEAIKSFLVAWKKTSLAKTNLEFIVVFNQFSGVDFSLPKKSKNNVFHLKNRVNKGFTGAVNDGVFFATKIRQATWCLVSNDDVLVDQDFFVEMLPQLKKNLAIVSCGVKDRDGRTQSLGMNYLMTGLTKPNLTLNINNPYFVGTAFFVSAKTIAWSFNSFGFLLAEFFFAYAEDLELALRLKKANKKVFIYQKNLLTHFGSITAKRGSAQQLFWGYRNLIFILLTHWSVVKIFLFLPFLLLGQFYSLLVLFKNRHFFLYPKIIWSVIRHRTMVFSYRKLLKEQL
ncbi:MAG: glycosyltransferase family 2 protein [Patescibacteria group bacterium]